MRRNGIGKEWRDGEIYIGEYKNDRRTEGREYELQEDGTHTLFNVKYDEDKKEIERKQVSKGHKMA